MRPSGGSSTGHGGREGCSAAEERIIKGEPLFERHTYSAPKRPCDLAFDPAPRNELDQDMVARHETKGAIQAETTSRHVANRRGLKSAVAVDEAALPYYNISTI